MGEPRWGFSLSHGGSDHRAFGVHSLLWLAARLVTAPRAPVRVSPPVSFDCSPLCGNHDLKHGRCGCRAAFPTSRSPREGGEGARAVAVPAGCRGSVFRLSGPPRMIDVAGWKPRCA